MISIIAARERNGGIGYKGKLPWPLLKEDMRKFKEVTTGHVVIMGRKTWESLGCKPLKNRANLVVTAEHSYPNVTTWSSLENAIEYAESPWAKKKEIFLIGGHGIWQEAFEKDLVDKVYMTNIIAHYDHDVKFPYIWDEVCYTSKWVRCSELIYVPPTLRTPAYTMTEIERVR